jgi:hypothetical protein
MPLAVQTCHMSHVTSCHHMSSKPMQILPHREEACKETYPCTPLECYCSLSYCIRALLWLQCLVPAPGAIRAPYYRSGVTDPSSWSSQLNHPAPWGEIGSSKFAVASPKDSLVAMVTDPTAVTAYWDKVRAERICDCVCPLMLGCTVYHHIYMEVKDRYLSFVN